jgi:hypothetical protein
MAKSQDGVEPVGDVVLSHAKVRKRKAKSTRRKARNVSK